MQKKSPIKQNILKYLEFKGLSRYKFYQESGITRGILDQDTGISEDNIARFLAYYSEVSPTWLLTGRGEMLLRQNEAYIVPEPAIPFGRTDKKEGIPLVEIKAVAGFGNGNFQISERDVKDYYIVPKFKNKKIDFMIEVEGSSMYPKYNSGDVVACRIIREDRFIQWNKTHLVATKDQGLIIKRIKPSEKEYCLKMISDNKDYDPFDVHQEEIDGIALIVGVIRLE